MYHSIIMQSIQNTRWDGDILIGRQNGFTRYDKKDIIKINIVLNWFNQNPNAKTPGRTERIIQGNTETHATDWPSDFWLTALV